MALLEAMSENRQLNFQSLDLLLSRLLVEAKRQSRLQVGGDFEAQSLVVSLFGKSKSACSYSNRRFN